MSAKAGKRPLRSLTAHEKLDAIRRVHDGESKASVARDIGVPESTLRGWCKNEDKISYLSRQSSPETDESLEHTHPSKRSKVDDSNLQPYNLSLKTNGGGTYSPNSETRYPTHALDYTKNEPDAAKTPLNLNTKPETPKTSNNMTERERNRAELARLSIELGLNRPEIFLAGINNPTSSLADLSANIALLTQWNNLFMQQQQQRLPPTNKSKITAPADTSTQLISPPAGLLTTVDSQKHLSKDKHMGNEAVRYWLQNQQANFPVTQSTAQTSNGISSSFAMPTTTPRTTIANSNGLGSVSVEQSSLFWDSYKLQAFQQMQQHLAQKPLADKPILYQQLTKDPLPKDTTEAAVDQRQNAENLSITDESGNKTVNNNNTNKNNRSRSVLDDLLCSNNSIVTTNKKDAKDGEILTKSEALMHGEKFLKWMETSSDPSVTATQILQFRTLLNNITSGTTTPNKTKVKRK